ASALVQHVAPAPGTTGVPAGGLLAVQFDRAMVPVAALDAPGRQSPIVVAPAVAGRGRWVGTSLWALSGSGGLAGATAYTVRVPAGLRALDGSVLAHALVWRFQTARPAVLTK